MKRFFLACQLTALYSFVLVSAFGQKDRNPKQFASTITPDRLKHHLYIIAGKDMEGRETATEGQRKAASYIEAQFISFGLQPGNDGSYFLKFPVYQDTLTHLNIEINGRTLQADKDFGVNIPINHTETLMGSEIVFVGSGIMDSARNDYQNINVAGKIVLVIPSSTPAPRTRNFYSIQENAQKNGAAAVLLVQNNFIRRTQNGKGQMYLQAFRKNILPNTYYISEQVAENIMGSDWQPAKAGTTPAKSYEANVLLDFSKSVINEESSDVLGYIEGTDLKDQYVFITAHYDHLGKRDTTIYYGADDDGSGTCAVLTLAEAFSKAKAAGKGPRRTIVFMTVSGEEKGLWGSAYYTDHPVFPLEKTSVDLNIDMIGRIDPKRKAPDSLNYIYIIGDNKLSSNLHPISETVNKKYSNLNLDYRYNDLNDPERFYYRSDHYNFARKGVPVIFYFNGTHADYHRPTDTPDKINYDLYAKRAQLVFYTAWEMANRDEMVKRDRD